MPLFSAGAHSLFIALGPSRAIVHAMLRVGGGRASAHGVSPRVDQSSELMTRKQNQPSSSMAFQAYARPAQPARLQTALDLANQTETNSSCDTRTVVIIGAGPAGLTAAYELRKAKVDSIVLEKDNIVGGIARTVNYKGYYFDIGGHRFFTKVKAVEAFWREILGAHLLKRNRLSRIYYNKRFFYYPLRASNALAGLGLWNSILIVASYVKAQLFPEKSEETLEQWVSNRFGKRLYRIFFKTYTEKVWGIPCTEISAEWAAQRIKGLSLFTALRNALSKESVSGAAIKTLTDTFSYPRLGPGMIWEKVADAVQQNGSAVRLRTDVTRICWDRANRQVVAVEATASGRRELINGTHFISSMPMRELIQRLDPAAPREVIEAASRLRYRDFLTVVLIIDQRDVFPDNWIYVHDPGVKVGRIQNFKNWSPHMVPDADKTCLGLEYFCFEGDGLWSMGDCDLIELGKRELELLGLAQASRIENGTVARMPKAYPVYDSTYRESLQIIRDFMAGLKNLQLIGRNGMHKYNNQDHSMLTAMLAVKNILGAHYDLWQVNEEQEYHEELSTDQATRAELAGLASTQPMVPQVCLKAALVQTFASIDKFALGAAVGSVCGLAVFTATAWLMARGGELIGPNLQLLGQYFFGYQITVAGAFIGMAQGFLWGSIFGWLFAFLRNLCFGWFVSRAKRKAASLVLGDL